MKLRELLRSPLRGKVVEPEVPPPVFARAEPVSAQEPAVVHLAVPEPELAVTAAPAEPAPAKSSYLPAEGAEPVRLVIWDLDETFWHGTLTEGGMRYRRDVHDMVIELARRGIVSSICSKNDKATVRAELEREGIWDYFVFPSINWDPKGPRVARLVEAVQLRAPTILFIDDNPMNLAEVQHYAPGIQVAPETFIEEMLDSPLFRGKPDEGLSRLKQYQLLQKKKTDEEEAGGDNEAFLRESGIVVTIEHDFELYLDRAIELINRTNQLNFTKVRLPEDMDAARAELRGLLSGYAVQAGIIRVHDRYGDYGYSGLYIMNSGPLGRSLKHFCFSCRTLNMGVETWLYQRLGRPNLRVRGEVLTDVSNDTREIDWIRVASEHADTETSNAHLLDYVYARGGCDLHAVTHYFNGVAPVVHGEFNVVEDGTMLPLNHSVFARHALRGLPEAARRVFTKMGYRDEHFQSALTSLPSSDRAVWVLSFWGEAAYALYRHNFTGLLLPVVHKKFKGTMQDITTADPVKSNVGAEFIAKVRRHFIFEGMIVEKDFSENLRLILERATPGVSVFILKANEQSVGPKGLVVHKRKQMVNNWTAAVARDFPNVALLDMNDFATADEMTANPNHFDRMVYFKVFQEIMRRVQGEAPPAAAAAD